MTLPRSLAVAVSSAALFVGLAGHHLDGPGLYYDEVHQVPAAFAWLGQGPEHFCLAWIGGVPWLTMTYSGAVKSALFALVLKLTGAAFSAALWRGFAIALVASGWIWCCATVGRRWGVLAQLAWAALMLTDTTVLLTTRHDWGPTALALLLRCSFLAVWLRSDRLSATGAFALGAIAGLATFEKLSSMVLLAPLAFAIAGAPRRHVLLAVAGLCAGALPLALVNLTTWSRGVGLISLTNLGEPRPGSWEGWSWWQFVADYLSLGQGEWARHWVFDRGIESLYRWLEAIVLAVLLAMACARPESRRLVAAYVAVGAALALMPRRTEAHHWIIGTPFQYAAIAVLVARGGKLITPARGLLLLLLALRLPSLWDTTTAIAENRTSSKNYDPAYTRVAKFLAAREGAMVVASTWGIANQIVAFSHGRKDAVHEPIYDDVELERFERTLVENPPSALYLVEVPVFAELFPARTARIRAAIASGRWREVPAEEELGELSAVRVRKFVDGRGARGCGQWGDSAIALAVSEERATVLRVSP